MDILSVSVQYPHNDTNNISMWQQRVFKLFSRNVFEYNLITDNAKAHSVFNRMFNVLPAGGRCVEQ